MQCADRKMMTGIQMIIWGKLSEARGELFWWAKYPDWRVARDRFYFVVHLMDYVIERWKEDE